MDYSKKQAELDLVKWLDSETKNYDTCGEYTYCKNCNKECAYPCAYAYETFTNATKISKPKTTKTIKTTTAKKPTTTKKATAKKTTTKKTTTKKTTTKKTTVAA